MEQMTGCDFGLKTTDDRQSAGSRVIVLIFSREEYGQHTNRDDCTSGYNRSSILEMRQKW